MTEGQQATLNAIVLRGPDPERDGVSTWRIIDLCRIAGERFGVTYREGACGASSSLAVFPGRKPGRAIPGRTRPRRSGSKRGALPAR